MSSVRNKYKGMSPAEAAEKIAEKYKDRDTNTISMNSYEMEMKELAKINKVLKLREEARQSLSQSKEKMVSKWGNTFGGVDPWGEGGGLDDGKKTQEEINFVASGRFAHNWHKKNSPNYRFYDGNKASENVDPVTINDIDSSPFNQLGLQLENVNPPTYEDLKGNNNSNIIPVYKGLDKAQMLDKEGKPIWEGDRSKMTDVYHSLLKKSLGTNIVGSGEDLATDKANLTSGDNIKSDIIAPGKLPQKKSFVSTNNLPTSTGLDLSTTEDEKGFGFDLKNKNAYLPALAGQAANILTNAGILSKGYAKVDPVNNPYESKVKTLMAERGINSDAIRERLAGQLNVGRDQARNVRSAQVSQALNQNLTQTALEQESQIGLQEQQMNNQYKADYANVLNNLGLQSVQANRYAEDLTARNQGAFETNLSDFSRDIADDSKFFTKSKLNDRYNKMLGDILNNKYADFGISADMVERIRKGTYTEDDILKLKSNPETAGMADELEQSRQKNLGNG